MASPIKLIITGPTGTAGAEVVRQALLHPSISHVTILSRRELPPHVLPATPNPKVNVILHSDYDSYPTSLLDQLKDHQAVVWAQGISAVGMKEDAYTKITYEYPLAAARAFAPLGTSGKKFTFVYLSGQGTDQEEGKARQMFGRIKGRAEKALALLPQELPTLASYSFRPGGILPTEPVPEASFMQRSIGRIGPLFKVLAPSVVITTPVLARGMIEAALRGSSGSIEGWEGKGQVGNKGVFENEEIKKLAKSSALAE